MEESLEKLPEKDREICLKLMEEFDKKGEVQIYQEIPYRFSKDKPITFAVLGPDWEGFLESVTAVFHGRNFNISYVAGISIKRKRLGFVSTEIECPNREIWKSFKKEAKHIVHDFLIAAIKDEWKRLLMQKLSQKVKRYEEVKRALLKRAKKGEAKGLLNEAGAFFLSRPESYIEERSISTLVEQIYNNYKMQQRVRKTGEIQARVRNIETVKEHLTTVSVAGYASKISLKDVLGVLREVSGGFQEKFVKQFFTEDGIGVYRIEITDRNGNPLGKAERERIKRGILDFGKETLEKVEYLDDETYHKTILPRLLADHRNYRIPHLYTQFILGTPDELRITIVTEKNRVKGDVGLKCAEVLEGRGFEVLSLERSPIPAGDLTQETNGIVIRVDRRRFIHPTEIYEEIAKRLRPVIGEFRDYTGTFPKLSKEKFGEVKKRLKRRRIPEDFVKTFFYGLLDTKSRMEMSPEELGEQIRLAYQVMRKFIKERRTTFSLKRFPKYYLVVFSFPLEFKIFENCLKIFKGIEMTSNRIAFGDFYLAIFRIERKGLVKWGELKKRIIKLLES